MSRYADPQPDYDSHSYRPSDPNPDYAYGRNYWDEAPRGGGHPPRGGARSPQPFQNGRSYEAPRNAARNGNDYRRQDREDYRRWDEYREPQRPAHPRPEYDYRGDDFEDPDRRDRLRQMGGVPVLPPTSRREDQHRSPALGYGENKAFSHHIANHGRFDTMKSLRTCENCPICQSMNEEEIAETFKKRLRQPPPKPSPILSGRAYRSPLEEEERERDNFDDPPRLSSARDGRYAGDAPKSSPRTHHRSKDDQKDDWDSKPTSKSRPRGHYIDGFSVPNDPNYKPRTRRSFSPRGYEEHRHSNGSGPREHVVTARALYDRDGSTTKELTISRGELLEVLGTKGDTALCRNSEGRTGHVQRRFLAFQSE